MAMNPRARRRSGAQQNWSGPRPPAATDPRRGRRRPPAPSPRPVESSEATAPPTLDVILDDFTESWERGDRPRAEAYLALLRPADSAELIYHEFCLAEASDLGPDPAEYLGRFPEHAGPLGRLFALHGALPASLLRAWAEPTDLPSAGDEIGPYRLVRELGRGSFARVFLAEQADLDHRLVVVKVSTRASAEPRLLARARHAQIVEVLRHVATEGGDLHLVCMPFLGGATLAAVLDARRKLGRRARTGLDLLADLDRASAPEYPAPGISRPAREVISGLSYPGALAWVVARLAEALDHAHRRGVAHGDLKPSNILLTAEATPMLFDFNLAVDRLDASRPGPATDAGGTPAYMAPERLRVVAGAGEVPPGRGLDLHRADLYALGLVLLEALTGRAPEVPRVRAGGPLELAGALARSRRGLPGSLRGRSPIPRSLRSILAKCLAPEPADRYARGDELAEDLDRWRADLPLAFAEEPRRSGLARRARRRSAALVVGALTLASALVVGSVASTILKGSRRDQAQAKLAMIEDRPDSGAFGLRPFAHWRADDGEDPAVKAARQLARYKVATDPDWRDRDDIRSLPDPQRENLEAWLFEQILRLAVALRDRPDSRGDWARALDLVEQAVARVPLAPLRLERLALRARLGLPEPEAAPPGAPSPPRWLEDYLAGVAAEPLHAREALGHYLDALRGRPDLFWAHYRAAVVACRLDEFPVAADHLRQCLARRPGNPVLHALLASTLDYVERDTPEPFRLGSMAEALREADRAVALAPDFAEAHGVRAMLRQASNQVDGVRADSGRFGLLTRFGGPAREMTLRASLPFHPGPNYSPHSDSVKALLREALAASDDPEARTLQAAGMAWDSRHSEAVAEYDRVLRADPDHLRARFQRATELRRLHPGSAIEEFAALIDHPRFEEVFHQQPTALRAFHYVATDLLVRGRIAEASEVALRGLEHVNRSRSFELPTLLARGKGLNQRKFSPRGETYYLLARIQASAAEGDPARIPLVVDYLDRSFVTSEKFRDEWYRRDWRFDGLRDQIYLRMSR